MTSRFGERKIDFWEDNIFLKDQKPRRNHGLVLIPLTKVIRKTKIIAGI